MNSVNIPQLSEFETAFGKLGANVGPRTGPNRRSQDAKEWFVMRRFMAVALKARVFELPITITQVPPPEPDFAAVHGPTRKAARIEITEATHPDDQREMTEFEKSGEELMLLGNLGGRFAGGASQPKLAWASDICDAILRKRDKSICRLPASDRHLIVYPNSNASQLIFDEADEREAFGHLKLRLGEGTQFAEALKGCQVHVLGKTLVGFDLAERFVLKARTAR